MAIGSHRRLGCRCAVCHPFQVIETISAVDRDEPQTGHRFLFSLLSPGDGGPANFTLRDNQGETLLPDPHTERQTGRDRQKHTLENKRERERQTDRQRVTERDRQRHSPENKRERERQTQSDRERHADMYADC